MTPTQPLDGDGDAVALEIRRGNPARAEAIWADHLACGIRPTVTTSQGRGVVPAATTWWPDLTGHHRRVVVFTVPTGLDRLAVLAGQAAGMLRTHLAAAHGHPAALLDDVPTPIPVPVDWEPTTAPLTRKESPR
ncbi:MAG: hypothetical protein ACRCYX_05730 [Dermatophilaceae bacterium]